MGWLAIQLQTRLHKITDLQFTSQFDGSNQLQCPVRLLDWLPDPLMILFTDSSVYPLLESQLGWTLVAGDWSCVHFEHNAMLEYDV